MPEGFTPVDHTLPANWPNARKWQRIRELLVGAVSVEVLEAEGGGYTLRVWYAAT